MGELLRAIDAYSGQPLTRLALALAPHVFARPGELRQAGWFEASLLPPERNAHVSRSEGGGVPRRGAPA